MTTHPALCEAVDAYLQGRLAAEEQAAFADHLTSCEVCAAHVGSWRVLGDQLGAAVADSRRVALSPESENRLLVRARERTGSARSAVPWMRNWIWALPAAAAIVAVIWWGAARQLAPSADARVLALATAHSREVIPAPEATGRVLVGPGDSHLLARLGDDRFGVERTSQVRLVDVRPGRTRLRLDRGTIAVRATHRTTGDELVVEARDIEVRVIGTRFLVELVTPKTIRVDVEEGAVNVVLPTGAWHRVAAGRALELTGPDNARTDTLRAEATATLARLLAEPQDFVERVQPAPTETPPQTSTGALHMERAPRPEKRLPRSMLMRWEKLIIDGALAQADREIARYLVAQPSDMEAWSLLADCRRKAAQWTKAVSAYRQIARRADPLLANRARFLAASILQDELADHAGAVTLLRGYLREAEDIRPLAAAATLRLAKSEHQLGHGRKARELLTGLVAKNPGTEIADEARALLKAWGSTP